MELTLSKAIEIYISKEVSEDKRFFKKVKYGLKVFGIFLNESKIKDLRNVKKEDVEKYVKYLNELSTKKKIKLAKQSKRLLYIYAKKLFRFLYLNEMLLYNPFDCIKVNFYGIEKIRKAFTREEIDSFLDSIETFNFRGLRMRAEFELMYSSALRRMEIVNLNLDDLNTGINEIVIRKSKNKKDRIVPISDVSKIFLEKYLSISEKYRNGTNAVFITSMKGKRLPASTLYRDFCDGLNKSGLSGKELTLHSIRHSTATHLLEAGVGIRYVQELLGHRYLSSTQKYIKLTIENMKGVYKRYHPRENEYYREIDGRYLKGVEELEEEVKKNRIRRRKRLERENKLTGSK